MAPATEAVPPDYYAGALAFFGIVLFAKFVTHQRKAYGATSWHVVCVVTAWFGAFLSVALLGWKGFLGWEDTDALEPRVVVALLAAVSATVLAVDGVFAGDTPERLRDVEGELRRILLRRPRRHAQTQAQQPSSEAGDGITTAVKDLPPHALDADEIERLWGLRPDQIATEALRRGEYRERRLMIEALAVKTNQRLAWIAIVAALVALAVPFIGKAVE
jgi:hypothetical protein